MLKDSLPTFTQHRGDLRQIYGDTLWLVDNLRILFSLLETRGVEFTDQEEGFIETTWKTIGGIQQHIENRIPLRELV